MAKRKSLFGQSQCNRDELRVPNLKGSAYKFSILIPTTEGEGSKWLIFSYREIEMLAKLLDADFGGSTNTLAIEETQHPLLAGRYKSGNETVTNTHARFEVYAQHNSQVIKYFQELKENLEKYSRDVIAIRLKENGHKTYKGEEQILVEYYSTTII